MANAREQMRALEAKLERIEAEIQRLQAARQVLIELRAEINGDAVEVAPKPRTRSPSVKPVVLDVMAEAGAAGATTQDVEARVRAIVPTVAKDTVASVLSRLKSDGALVYEGERYFDKRHAPIRPSPVEGGFRVVG